MLDNTQNSLPETPAATTEAMSPKPVAYALLVLITAIWGGTFLVARYALQFTGPFMFVSIRFTVAAIALSLVYARRLRHITRSELVKGSIIGLIMFVELTLLTVGLQTTPASKAAFLTGLYVPMVPLFGILLWRQWPTWEASVGVTLSLFGLLLLSLNSQFNLRIGHGEWCILGCALVTALHILCISKFAANVDAIHMTIVQITVTAMLSISAFFLSGERHVFPPVNVWIPGLGMGLLVTAFSLMVMNRVQPMVGSTRATLIYALEPVWAGLFGYLAGERLAPIAWIGGGLIVVGMILGEMRFRSRKAAQPEYCQSTGY